jgi:hypothetical protein
MKSINNSLMVYKDLLIKGEIQTAYRAIMEFMHQFRNHLNAKYPEYIISGNIYQGYMDMSYFAFTPGSLAEKKLKIAIVFIHESISFEIWLSGVNKKVQEKYWQLLRHRIIKNCLVQDDINGLDYIARKPVTVQIDFEDQYKLKQTIESEVLSFIEEMKLHLA